MTDPLITDPSEPVVHAGEDRTLPIVIYALFLIGLVNGLTILIGFVMAYALKGASTEPARSHYVFLIRTVWISLAWLLLGGLLLVLGVPLTLVLIGFLFLKLAVAIFALIGIWFTVRCVVGLIYISRREPYPRPRAWLI